MLRHCRIAQPFALLPQHMQQGQSQTQQQSGNPNSSGSQHQFQAPPHFISSLQNSVWTSNEQRDEARYGHHSQSSSNLQPLQRVSFYAWKKLSTCMGWFVIHAFKEYCFRFFLIMNKFGFVPEYSPTTKSQFEFWRHGGQWSVVTSEPHSDGSKQYESIKSGVSYFF